MPQYPAAELQLLSIKRHHLSRDSIGKSVKNCRSASETAQLKRIQFTRILTMR